MKWTTTPAALAACALAALTLFSLSSCDKIKKPGAADAKAAGGASGAATSSESTIFAVNTTTATKGQIKDYLALSGDIVAGSAVDAYSDVAGKVTKLYVSVGSKVRKGSPLAEVDPSKPGMSFVPGVAKAPISGTIVSLPAQVGMTVSQAMPVARISRTDDIELRTYVAERFVSKMRLGLPAQVELDAYPGSTFTAKVKELSPVIDPSSRTMEVRLALPSTEGKLKAGMFAKIRVVTEEKESIVKIPAQAVVRRFGENYVFVVQKEGDGAVARKRLVTPGILIDGKLEITKGLNAGEEIVIRGQTLLDEGSRVNVVDTIAPLPIAD